MESDKNGMPVNLKYIEDNGEFFVYAENQI